MGKCKKCVEEYNKLKKELEKYKKLSLLNELTGLWNRRKLKDDLERYLAIKKRKNINFLVMMIDLDNFKKINDNLGHEEGDLILKKTAKILQKNIRKYENCYHISGDEFIVIFSHYSNPSFEIKVIRKIKKALSKNNIKASIGCSVLSKNALSIADRRMYDDKRRNKNL